MFSGSTAFFNNCTFPVVYPATPISHSYSSGNSIAVFTKINGVIGNNMIRSQLWNAYTSTSLVYGSSSFSWIIATFNNFVNVRIPANVKLTTVLCKANRQVTVKIWMRRNDALLTGKLLCTGGQIGGVNTDVSSSLTTTNAWEELAISFTPNEDGAVNIYAQTWWAGSTSYLVYVDKDISIAGSARLGENIDVGFSMWGPQTNIHIDMCPPLMSGLSNKETALVF